MILLGKAQASESLLLQVQAFTVQLFDPTTNGAIYRMVPSFSPIKRQTELNFVLCSGIPRLTRNTWNMSRSWLKSKEKDSTAPFSPTLKKNILKLIFAIRLAQPLKPNRLLSRLASMECPRPTLSLALKTTSTCGNTKAKHRGSPCLIPLLKQATAKWADKSAGLLRISQT